MTTLGLRFTFLHTGEHAEATLRLDEAPVTCQSVWNRLPVAGVCHHACYSGSEGVLILPDPLRVAPENATHEVVQGDIGFTWLAPGDAYGVTHEFAEVCWFYDQDARPSMHEGPVPVNVFARFIGDPAAFYARSRAMRRSGVTGLLIERLTVADRGMEVAYHDPAAEAPLRPRLAKVGGRALMIARDGGRCRVVWTEDGGLEWTIGPDLRPGVSGSVAIGPDDTVWAAVGTHTQGPIRVAASRDRGVTWTHVPHADLSGARPALTVTPGGELIVLYETGTGIAGARSLDGGGSWRAMPTGLEDREAHHPVGLYFGDGRLICAFAPAGASSPDRLLVMET